MKSQLEETKQKIIELVVSYGFPTPGVNIYPPDKIIVEPKRDDMPEGEGIYMTIKRRSGQRWMISDHNKPHYFQYEEEMLEFIENKLQELVKCCG